jgi:hypothetical protein
MSYLDLGDILKRLKINDNSYWVEKRGEKISLKYKENCLVSFLCIEKDKEMLKALLKKAIRIHHNRLFGEKRKHYNNMGYVR